MASIITRRDLAERSISSPLAPLQASVSDALLPSLLPSLSLRGQDTTERSCLLPFAVHREFISVTVLSSKPFARLLRDTRELAAGSLETAIRAGETGGESGSGGCDRIISTKLQRRRFVRLGIDRPAGHRAFATRNSALARWRDRLASIHPVGWIDFDASRQRRRRRSLDRATVGSNFVLPYMYIGERPSVRVHSLAYVYRPLFFSIDSLPSW
jgi:hypothetical protein